MKKNTDELEKIFSLLQNGGFNEVELVTADFKLTLNNQKEKKNRGVTTKEQLVAPTQMASIPHSFTSAPTGNSTTNPTVGDLKTGGTTIRAANINKPSNKPSGTINHVKSNRIGFYMTGESDKKVKTILLKPGQAIKKGQIIGYLRSLNQQEPLFSTLTGTLQKILKENGDSIEYGETLLEISNGTDC